MLTPSLVPVPAPMPAMDVDIVPAAVPGGQQGMESTKNLPPKRKRSSRVVKSKEYVEDSELEEGAGEVSGGETEEDELMIPVDIKE